MPEQPYFSAEAHCNGTNLQESGEVPEWCDLTVTVECLDPDAGTWARRTEDGEIVLHMTRAAGEVLIDVTYSALHPYAGRSIGEIMKRQLDEVVARLMTKTDEDGDKHLARGMAMTIACLHNPVAPDWEMVRDEAVQRYKDHA